MRKKRLPPENKRCRMREDTPERCRAARQRGSDYCYFHERNPIKGLGLRNPTDIRELLEEMVQAVAEKRMDPQQAYAIGWLLKQLRQNSGDIERQRWMAAMEASGGVGAWLKRVTGEPRAQTRPKEGADEKEEDAENGSEAEEET